MALAMYSAWEQAADPDDLASLRLLSRGAEPSVPDWIWSGPRRAAATGGCHRRSSLTWPCARPL